MEVILVICKHLNYNYYSTQEMNCTPDHNGSLSAENLSDVNVKGSMPAPLPRIGRALICDQTSVV